MGGCELRGLTFASPAVSLEFCHHNLCALTNAALAGGHGTASQPKAAPGAHTSGVEWQITATGLRRPRISRADCCAAMRGARMCSGSPRAKSRLEGSACWMMPNSGHDATRPSEKLIASLEYPPPEKNGAYQMRGRLGRCGCRCSRCWSCCCCCCCSAPVDNGRVGDCTRPRPGPPCKNTTAATPMMATIAAIAIDKGSMFGNLLCIRAN